MDRVNGKCMDRALAGIDKFSSRALFSLEICNVNVAALDIRAQYDIFNTAIHFDLQYILIEQKLA